MLKTYSFKEDHVRDINRQGGFLRHGRSRLRPHVPLNNLVVQKDEDDEDIVKGKYDGFYSLKPNKPPVSCPAPLVYSSPRHVLDAAATKVQKVYKSYRTRRNLADCAVVVEELWWKALDFAALNLSSVSFYKNDDKHETAASRWARARTRAAKVGKGLSQDEKAQKLALQHWLEAIDPRHRYGHNLHFYYDLWTDSKSTQPFFYWLDVGDGKELNLKKCPRFDLQRQCIKYMGPKEREAYRVIVEGGKLVYMESGSLLTTEEGSKWIFVLSTAKALFVGRKKKGVFQHSSFLSGAATSAAGRLVARAGILQAIWPYSGHYLPTEDNFMEFITFLEEHKVDLTNVKRCSIDDDDGLSSVFDAAFAASKKEKMVDTDKIMMSNLSREDEEAVNKNQKPVDRQIPPPVFNLAKRLSCKWASGVGPRIGCVRDYPADLQCQALEKVNLSPRVNNGAQSSVVDNWPIPSPRPSPKFLVSPRLAYMGLPSPKISAQTRLS